jgi:hypothetical protein
MRPLLALAAACLLAAACSSSSNGPSGTTEDGSTPDHRETAPKDAGHDAPTEYADADAESGARPDAGHEHADAKAHLDARATKDAVVRDSPFEAFVYPEAAIPHDTGSDAPVSPCSALPDLSSYCAPKGDAGSTGFYVCMQGNGVYSACSPGTTCAPTDAGGVACSAP